MHGTKKIVTALALIVLLPALFYSVYEISALDETEEMVSEMYRRQLDAVLFSVNQHALDVASGWATQLENDPRGGAARLRSSNPSVIGVLTDDSSWNRGTPLLRDRAETFDRLARYQAAAYRKLEPSPAGDSAFLILFVPASDPARRVGILVNSERFIDGVVGQKLRDIAQNDFIIAVRRRSTGAPLYSTSPGTAMEGAQTRQLWIFPDHDVAIRLRGVTIQEAARERFSRNLALIGIMDAVLLAAAWFVYRTIRREMELVALRADFVSNVSHELRTPLSLIRMFAETLQMKRVTSDAKRQEYYTIILHETERLTRLINNILNFSRMESDSRKYQLQPTRVDELVEGVLTVYAYKLESLSFTVVKEVEPSLPAVMADGEALAEALHNLIDNAVKYGGEGRYLRIAVRRSSDGVAIAVEDRGIGIPAEHQGKVFDKFYRVSHGLVHTAKGSGLGLAIVRHIVQAHGGHIAVESAPGRGSTFTIHLPLRAA